MQPLNLPGELGSLEQIRRYTTQAARDAGLEKARAYKLQLAVDEIATNIINYGYQGKGIAGEISIEADLDEHTLTIALGDSSDYFDPTIRPSPPPEYFTQPLEERNIGGWGVYLAIQNVDQFYYYRIQDRNHSIFSMFRPTHGNLLLIDPIQERSLSLAQHLEGLGYTITCVESEQQALDLVRQQKFEMLLIDLPLQKRSADDFIKSIKADNALRSIPVLVLAGPEHLEEAEMCMKSGAEDTVALPFRPILLAARISTQLERHRLRIARHVLNDVKRDERDVQIG